MRNVLLAGLLTASLANAQAFDFTIDNAASQWTWSGTTDLGPLNGNPSNSFSLNGNFLMEIGSGAHPIATARFAPGGSAAVVPDLSGVVPNPIPGFPPLATVDVTGLTLEFVTGTFNVDAAGNFATDITATALTGMVVVTPLVGAQTTTDLAGTAGTPSPITGSLTQSGMSLHLDSPQSNSFSFVDPGSGIGGSFQLVGDLVGDANCAAPSNYCVATMNSSGGPASMGFSGSTRIQDNALTLQASGLPLNKFGYFLMSETEFFLPNFAGSQGNLCIGAPQVRFNQFVLNSGQTGTMQLTLDNTALPQGAEFHPGALWHFQLWFRDVNPGLTSNTTDGLKIVFCP